MVILLPWFYLRRIQNTHRAKVPRCFMDEASFHPAISHEPFLLVVYDIAEFAHEFQITFIQSPLLNGGDVFPQFAHASRRR